uniref:Uncharacterized protein n=1 Tax=Rhizophora mucronata TaxID=61149 RepID=A0A2P2MZU1_RHIMU
MKLACKIILNLLYVIFFFLM